MTAGRLFAPRILVAVVAASAALFGALVLLLAFAQDFRTGRDGRPHALSVSAIGFQGLVQLAGHDGDARLARRSDAHATENLLVVTLEPGFDRDRVRDLLAARRALPTLIVLPKWTVRPRERQSGWVDALAPGAGAGPLTFLDAPVRITGTRSAAGPAVRATGRGMLEGLSAPMPRAPQILSGEGIEPLLVDPNGRVLVARLVQQQTFFIVADPDLLNNHGLKNPETARGALRMLEEFNSTGAEAVHFDLVLNGFGSSRGLLRLLFAPPFLAFTLAALAVGILAGLHGFVRFGPARRPEREIAFGKAALVENSAGLIRLAGREHHLGSAYAALIGEETARARGAPPGLSGEARDTYLDGLTPSHRSTFTEFSGRLLRARDRDSLLAAARALYEWKKDITR